MRRPYSPPRLLGPWGFPSGPAFADAFETRGNMARTLHIGRMIASLENERAIIRLGRLIIRKSRKP